MLPTDILRLDPVDLAVCKAAMDQGMATAAEQMRSSEGPVFPVAVVGAF